MPRHTIKTISDVNSITESDLDLGLTTESEWSELYRQQWVLAHNAIYDAAFHLCDTATNIDDLKRSIRKRFDDYTTNFSKLI